MASVRKEATAAMVDNFMSATCAGYVNFVNAVEYVVNVK